jgi:hypothetical protein
MGHHAIGQKIKGSHLPKPQDISVGGGLRQGIFAVFDFYTQQLWRWVLFEYRTFDSELAMCTGNPWVVLSIPTPIPMETHTHSLGMGFWRVCTQLTHGSGGYKPMAGIPGYTTVSGRQWIKTARLVSTEEWAADNDSE